MGLIAGFKAAEHATDDGSRIPPPEGPLMEQCRAAITRLTALQSVMILCESPDLPEELKAEAALSDSGADSGAIATTAGKSLGLSRRTSHLSC